MEYQFQTEDGQPNKVAAQDRLQIGCDYWCPLHSAESRLNQRYPSSYYRRGSVIVEFYPILAGLSAEAQP